MLTGMHVNTVLSPVQPTMPGWPPVDLFLEPGVSFTVFLPSMVYFDSFDQFQTASRELFAREPVKVKMCDEWIAGNVRLLSQSGIREAWLYVCVALQRVSLYCFMQTRFVHKYSSRTDENPEVVLKVTDGVAVSV